MSINRIDTWNFQLIIMSVISILDKFILYHLLFHLGDFIEEVEWIMRLKIC